MQAQYQFLVLPEAMISLQIQELQWKAESSEMPSNGMAVVFAGDAGT